MDTEKYLNGAWDIHVHASPSLFPRWGDVVDLARECSRNKMAGFVLKYHHGSSVEAAYVTDKITDDMKVYGGVTLNYPVGGLNPHAVDTAISLGGKFVWLPTIHASNHKDTFGVLGGFHFQKSRSELVAKTGLSVLERSGKINRKTRDILDVMNKKNVILATGHISVAEIFELKKYMRREGLEIPVLVNHALFKTTSMKEDTIRDLSDDNTWFETVYLTVSPMADPVPIKHVAEIIGRTPGTRWIIASDSGQVNNLRAPEALMSYARMLESEGIDKQGIIRMLKYEPETLLNS